MAVAVLKAFQLLEEMNGSQSNLLDILSFGKDLYCKGDHDASRLWPTTWASCVQILKEFGYKDPRTYYICLNEKHPYLYSTLESSSALCPYCQMPGAIQFHYLPLSDKIKRWCSIPEFCQKMTTHWLQKDRWFSTGPQVRFPQFCEIWDGHRFSELKWFWDPEQQWLLPVRCSFCKKVINSSKIASSLHRIPPSMSEINIECTHCYRSFMHTPRYARGDPRNLALIGHWDGWQPFSTSNKHSCGELHTW